VWGTKPRTSETGTLPQLEQHHANTLVATHAIWLVATRNFDVEPLKELQAFKNNKI
jgi:hypothetical protein